MPENKHLLSLLPGAKEDTASCRDFLRDLKARGMNDPILVKLRNLQSKVPEERQREVIPMARAAYQAPSAALARLAVRRILKDFGRANYPLR